MNYAMALPYGAVSHTSVPWHCACTTPWKGPVCALLVRFSKGPCNADKVRHHDSKDKLREVLYSSRSEKLELRWGARQAHGMKGIAGDISSYTEHIWGKAAVGAVLIMVGYND